MNPRSEQWVTVRAAAAASGIRPDCLRSLMRRGVLRAKLELRPMRVNLGDVMERVEMKKGTLSVRVAAEKYGYNRRYLERLARQKRVQHVIIGRQIYVVETSVQKYANRDRLRQQITKKELYTQWIRDNKIFDLRPPLTAAGIVEKAVEAGLPRINPTTISTIGKILGISPIKRKTTGQIREWAKTHFAAWDGHQILDIRDAFIRDTGIDVHPSTFTETWREYRVWFYYHLNLKGE